jgi:cyclopropane-fatty-acyl-phospholipid synthase
MDDEQTLVTGGELAVDAAGGRPPHLRAGSPSSPVNGLDRWLLHKAIAAIGGLPYHVRLWNGEEVPTANPTPRNTVTVNSRGALYRSLLNPNRYFGDDYCRREIEIDGSLVDFFESIYNLLNLFNNSSVLQRAFALLDKPRRSTLRRARHNIQRHYDVGNPFYRLWLDQESMQYTCAYFPRAGMSLEQAQAAKMHHVCRKLQLKPGESVVETGCGWGGFALFMARHYGVKVRAYNISREQIVYASERAREAGLADRVQYIEDDYRNAQGPCDVFVSIGMLEHVGPGDYASLGRVIDQCLTQNGRGLIHSIGRNRPIRTTSWIERRIFPGCYPPTLKEMMAIFEPYPLAVQDVENLRLHYAETLRHWYARFEDHAEQIRAMYDEDFLRAWSLYLAGSQASFSTGWLQLFQVLFNRAHSNKLARSREFMYPADANGAAQASKGGNNFAS